MQERINQLESVILEKEAFLKGTDYQSIREYEGGEPMPQSVKEARAMARQAINDAQAEIEVLRAKMKEEEENEIDHSHME